MRYILIALMLLATVLTGCEPKEDLVKSPAAQKPKATLPEPIDFSNAVPKTKYADGSFTVWGLTQGIEAQLMKEVKVRGIVIEKHPCTEEMAPCPTPAYLIISDKQEPSFHTLVIISGAINDLSYFEVGKSYLFEGTATQSTPDGQFVRNKGLLMLD